MQKRLNSWHSKLTLAAAGLTGFVMLCGAPQLRADNDCQRRTERAAHHLREAVDRHGADSRQADHARDELDAARHYCWNKDHRWWDSDDNRWHNQQDWDNDNGNQNYDHQDRDHHDRDDQQNNDDSH